MGWITAPAGRVGFSQIFMPYVEPDPDPRDPDEIDDDTPADQELLDEIERLEEELDDDEVE